MRKGADDGSLSRPSHPSGHRASYSDGFSLGRFFMKAPAGLSREARADWRRGLAALRAPSPSDRHALERYVRAVDLARSAWAEISDDELLVPGSKGQQVAHPMIAVALAAERDAARFGQDLGLERAAPVRRPGRPFGALSAPDRKAAGEPPRLRLAGTVQPEPERITRVPSTNRGGST